MTMQSIGIIGCGNISDIYLKNLAQAPNLRVVAVADQIRERAEQKAQAYEIDARSVEDLLADPEIFLVLNLTIPASHYAVATEVLSAHKHVYGEKPLALTFKEGSHLLALSQKVGKRIGSAPDTVLGGGIQTARKLIDDGWIGRPVAATAFMAGHGHESWHPDPAFYYQPGGGPLFDMGPYYLSALFQLLGPITEVGAMAGKAFSERIVRSEPLRGTHIPVEVETHVAGELAFENGAIATLVMSFDVWHAQLPRIEIYGSEGSLSVPDPNTFGGPVKVRRFDGPDWSEVPVLFGPTDNARGIGVVDLVDAIFEDRVARADGAIALHVLEVMEGLLNAAFEGRHQSIASRPARPPAMAIGPAWLPK
jgi:predicted dehydrogenase